ncbi:MAG: redoxin domain-containing protein [Alphaproteobacteria bacterium]|nr:redoxin domain-containing protein [Alphaproteobacteria bacterium]
MTQLEIGNQAPAFSLSNQAGKQVGLADHAGRKVLIWFFPRAFGKN